MTEKGPSESEMEVAIATRKGKAVVANRRKKVKRSEAKPFVKPKDDSKTK